MITNNTNSQLESKFWSLALAPLNETQFLVCVSTALSLISNKASNINFKSSYSFLLFPKQFPGPNFPHELFLSY